MTDLHPSVARDDSAVGAGPTRPRSRPTSSGAPPPRRTRSRAPPPRTAAAPSIWDTFCAHPGPGRATATPATSPCDHYHRYARGRRADGASWACGRTGSRSPGRGSSPAAAGRRTSAGPRLLRRLVDELLGQRHRAVGDALPLGPAAGAGGRRRLAGAGRPRTGSPSYADLDGAPRSATGSSTGPRSTSRGARRSSATAPAAARPGPARAGRRRGRRPPPAARPRPGRRGASAAAAPDAQVGITLNLYPVTPGRRPSRRPRRGPPGRRAAQPARSSTRCCRGELPRRRPWPTSAAVTGFDFVRDGDLATIAAPLDLLGVNYYTRLRRQHLAPMPGARRRSHAVPPAGRLAPAMGWERRPRRARRAAAPGDRATTADSRSTSPRTAPPSTTRSTDDGDVHDADRMAYLAATSRPAPARSPTGVPLRGYFAWSLLDNFEWAEGYGKRFGIVHVDYATQERTVKASGRWYADFIRAHGSAVGDTDRGEPASARSVRRSTRSRPAPASVAAPSPASSTARRRSPSAPGRRSRPRSTELGYVPNLAARALVTQRTDSVALVVSETRGAALRRAVLRRRRPGHQRRR